MPQSGTAVDTAPAIGVPGQLATFQGMKQGRVLSKTSEESSLGIPFGVVCKQGTADDGVLLPTAQNDKLVGVSVYSNEFARPSEIDTDGLQPGTTFGVVDVGPVMVTTEDAATPADEVHVRISANGGNTQLGAFRATADGAHTVDITGFARWLTSADAGGVAIVDVDFRNAALVAADS